jgi:transposase-like protein
VLSDNDVLKNKKSPVTKKQALIGQTNHRYSDAQKLDAIKLYLMSGNMSAVAVATKIPLITLQTWKKTQWWMTMVNELRNEGNIVLSERMRKVVEKSWGVVEAQEQFTVSTEQIGSKLDELAKQFALMVNGKKPSKEAEDIEYVEQVGDSVLPDGDTQLSDSAVGEWDTEADLASDDDARVGE